MSRALIDEHKEPHHLIRTRFLTGVIENNKNENWWTENGYGLFSDFHEDSIGMGINTVYAGESALSSRK